ncbi:cytosolic carboxypeptidase 3 isoform 3-T3 [Alca torda]
MGRAPPSGRKAAQFHLCSSFSKAKQILLSSDLETVVPPPQGPQNLDDSSPASQFSLVYWPHQLEVIRDRIEHIDWIPTTPEPLYTPTGLEMMPPYQTPDKGTVIYLGEEANKNSCFMYSRVRGLCPLQQILRQKEDNTLIFEARFESGNLQKVVKVNEFEYQLTLRTDLYTSRHTQWYYFQVSNMQAGMPYRFTIVNFTNRNSLYKRGLRPLLYSEADAKKHKVGWRRTGNEIKYYKNNAGQGGHQYFSLTWTLQFPHDLDTCYFAHCYPYTYSNLQEYLVAISKDPVKSTFCKIHILCHSLAGNIVYVLTITNPPESGKGTERKAVILTARVHPGETNSSWIMKGFLDYILGDSGAAQLLRDSFVFKVVPMLNPDGVIVGNHRCSLTGQDLNRKYRSNGKKCYPSIWYTRNMIKRVMGERDVFLYCDIHGHNVKKNVFMYGCERKQQAKAPYMHPRVFPLLLSKSCPDKFSFTDCRFRVRKSKEGTGRVVMWKMGINNSYTLEASICGSKLGCRQSTHFDMKDLESIGQHFCDALLDYCVHNKTQGVETQRKIFQVPDPVKKVKLPIAASAKQVGGDFSCPWPLHPMVETAVEGDIREAENSLSSISSGAPDPLHQHITETPFPSLAGLTGIQAVMWCFAGKRDDCCCLGREGEDRVMQLLRSRAEL